MRRTAFCCCNSSSGAPLGLAAAAVAGVAVTSVETALITDVLVAVAPAAPTAGLMVVGYAAWRVRVLTRPTSSRLATRALAIRQVRALPTAAPRASATACARHAHRWDACGGGLMNAPSVRRWPVIPIAALAAVAVWSRWVGLGMLCRFGIVHPLPGIADSFRLNTAITLPAGGTPQPPLVVGMEWAPWPTRNAPELVP